MARLEGPELADMNADQKRIHEDIVAGPRGEVVGPLAIWLHRAGLAEPAQKLGQYCRYDSSLPPNLSELAILTTARIWDAPFEWDSHIVPAKEAGLAEDILAALEKDEKPAFKNEKESIVYRVTRAMHLERRLPDALYNEALDVLGKDALVDLIGLLGYYTLISMTLNAFDVPGIE